MTRDRLWNSNYIKVMFTNFALYFAFYLVTPLLPIYLSETFGATKDTIGLILSGYTVTALLIRPFSGFLADRFQRKTVLLVCLLFYFLLFFGYVVAGSLLLFAIVRTLHGGPFGATTVANSTMAIDVLPSSRRREGIGFYGVGNNVACAIAPTAGLYIYHSTGDFMLIFWTAIIAAFVALICAATIKIAPRELVLDKAPISLDRFFLRKGWMIAVNITFFGFCWGVLSNYIAIYGKETLGIMSGTGTWFLILSLCLIASRIIGNRSLREGRLLRSATEGVFLSMAGYTIFLVWPTMTGYYLSAVLIGLGNGHIWPAFQNMIIGIASKNERGTANSTILTAWDLGMGIGILLGGVIAETVSYHGAFLSMVIMHLGGTIMYLFFTERKMKRLMF